MNAIKKIAIIGKGKTGGQVVELARQTHRPYEVFDSHSDFTQVAWDSYCGAIVFIPAAALATHLETFIQSNLPMIIGTTGFEFPSDLRQRLLAKKISWIHGRNFSLGMQLVHSILTYLGTSSHLLPEAHGQIHEIHHTKKLDAPSGTAKAWAEWYGDKNIPITSERVGDVIGDHRFTLATPYEKISVQHQALSRSIFAQGAVWALDFLLQNQKAKQLYGLLPFEQIVPLALH
ncbi:MAG: hypothetical protein A2X86_21185 [Bdellovibrionales bacterium GWA2_49_15]|nr:MAG: hypothetical protein A2X86_21185 [Bdellovibrionales bacterium GWA2_49_15]HAZ14893.1 hypothetical protein [Bdellovibrionales bacterium]